MWLMKALQDKPHGYTLKGAGFPSYHLGADIKRVDKDVVDKGVLTMGSTTHAKRSLENYERIVGLKPPKRVSQPMHHDCHPELDTTDIMCSDGRQICWSLIGMLQWAVTLGRLDTHHAAMCMSRFRATRSLSLEVRSTGISSHGFIGLTCRLTHSSILSRWGVTSEPILGQSGRLFIPFRNCSLGALNNHSGKRCSVHPSSSL